ncbi:PIN domain-containing protein [Deinococcus pimensis]|uniref:PIN domain-containing protein n=1 Tax=Deinococcus pimensis TaxID=309888 RepID=UPI000485DFFB|nr:PIN domain-containing protein [Deinococcus pimensis]
MRYLLDADTLSFVTRGHPDVIRRLAATSPSALAVSAVTLMEIEYGLARRPEKRAVVEEVLDPLFEDIHVLPYAVEDARATANVRATLAATGQPIGPYDVLLAGTALARGLVLVSHNTREYGRVGGLRVEDWTASA